MAKRKTALKKGRKSKRPSQIKVYPKKTRKFHIANDKKFLAKRVGLRKSASGRIYSERRENRSDVNRKTRL